MISKEVLKKMVENIRFGFATNSSSTHSIIFKNDDELKDKEAFDDYEFGWGNFVLSSPEAKEKYLNMLYFANISSLIGYKNFEKFIDLIYMDEEERTAIKSGYIDHQSMIYLPKKAGTNDLDTDFFEGLKTFLLDNRIAILGGNDNDEYMGGIDYGPDVDFLKYWDMSDFQSRKNGNYFMLINPKTGEKARIIMSFEDEKSIADAPELIDVKITDFCLSGCRFCYQDSTPEGLHGELDYIRQLFSTIEPCTEIALGGGDVMKHPDIVKILEYGKAYKLIMNITVNDIDWIKNVELVNAINKNVSGIGISITQKRDFDKIQILHETLDKHIQLSIHYIPDIGTTSMLRDVVQYTNEFRSRSFGRKLSILLLGYKTIGRGSHVKHELIEGMAETLVEIADEFRYVPIGVDTKMIQDYPDIKKYVSKRFYNEFEGEYSMYIDAVKQTAHPSSYDIIDFFDVSKPKKYPENTVNKAFKEIQKLEKKLS